MPSTLGGMGLYISKDEFRQSLKQLPLIVQRLLHFTEIKDFYFDSDYVLNQCMTLLRKWLTLGSFRAYLCRDYMSDTMRNLDLELAIKDTLEVKTFREVFSLLGQEERSAQFINDSIRLRGFAPIADVIDLLKKGYLFQSILTGYAEEHSFKTMPLANRFRSIWEVIEEKLVPLIELDLSESLDFDETSFDYLTQGGDRLTLYVQVHTPITIDYYSLSEQRQITIVKSVIDQITSGLPLLSIPLSKIAFYM